MRSEGVPAPAVAGAGPRASAPEQDAETAMGVLGEILGALWEALTSVVPGWVLVVAPVAVLVLLLLLSQWGRRALSRFATGRPMDGIARTNATAWRWGTRGIELYQDTRPTRWELRPYAQRALIRWTVTVVVVALVVGALLRPLLTVGLVVAAVGALVAYRTRRQWGPHARRAGAAGVARVRGALAPAGGRVPAAIEAGPGAEVEVSVGGQVAVITPDPSSEDVEEEDVDEEDEDWSVSSRDMDAEILYPLWDVVRPALELSEASQAPRRYIRLPESVDVDDAEVVIALPRAWEGEEQQVRKLNHAVLSRLPGGKTMWRSSYKLSGSEHTATFRRIPHPPKRVKVSEVWDVIEKAKENAPVFAIGPRWRPITADLVADSPHIAISMGSGAGKSTTARAILAPMLHHGAEVHILDFKRTSHRWAKGLPNVRIYKEIPDIHDALVWLGETAQERHRIEDDNPGIEFHRIVVVGEELNSLADELEDYWEECKKNDKNLPKNSPAFKGLSHISYGGRSACVHLIAIAQKLDARLFGRRSGGAVRENFALRLLARFTKNAWKQLADISPMAKLKKYLGRIAVVVQGEWVEAQVIHWPEETARDYALSGIVTPASQVAVTATVVAEEPPPTGDESQPEPGDGHTPAPAPPAGTGAPGVVGGRRLKPRKVAASAPENALENVREFPDGGGVLALDAGSERERPEDRRVLVGLKEAYERGIFDGVSYDNLRKIHSRESKKGMAPRPVQEKPKKWDLDELAEWWADRAAEKAAKSG